MVTLGEIIRTYRKEHNMSMGDFSKVSGLSKTYIHQLEKNQHPTTGKPIVPTLQTIKQVADAMGRDVTKLFYEIYGYLPVEEETHEEQYYLNPETARIAQEVYDNPETRMLLDASRNARPEDIRFAAEMLKRFKETNQDG